MTNENRLPNIEDLRANQDKPDQLQVLGNIPPGEREVIPGGPINFLGPNVTTLGPYGEMTDLERDAYQEMRNYYAEGVDPTIPQAYHASEEAIFHVSKQALEKFGIDISENPDVTRVMGKINWTDRESVEQAILELDSIFGKRPFWQQLLLEVFAAPESLPVLRALKIPGLLWKGGKLALSKSKKVPGAVRNFNKNLEEAVDAAKGNMTTGKMKQTNLSPGDYIPEDFSHFHPESRDFVKNLAKRTEISDKDLKRSLREYLNITKIQIENVSNAFSLKWNGRFEEAFRDIDANGLIVTGKPDHKLSDVVDPFRPGPHHYEAHPLYRKEALPPGLSDIAQNPTPYLPYLSPLQIKFLDDFKIALGPYHRMMDDMGMLPPKKAINKLLGGEPNNSSYIPRGRARNINNEEVTEHGTSLLEGKSTHLQERKFQTMTEGVDSGFRYEPFEDVIRGYSRDVQTDTANQVIGNMVKQKGGNMTVTQKAMQTSKLLQAQRAAYDELINASDRIKASIQRLSGSSKQIAEELLEESSILLRQAFGDESIMMMSARGLSPEQMKRMPTGSMLPDQQFINSAEALIAKIDALPLKVKTPEVRGKPGVGQFPSRATTTARKKKVINDTHTEFSSLDPSVDISSSRNAIIKSVSNKTGAKNIDKVFDDVNIGFVEAVKIFPAGKPGDIKKYIIESIGKGSSKTGAEEHYGLENISDIVEETINEVLAIAFKTIPKENLGFIYNDIAKATPRAVKKVSDDIADDASDAEKILWKDMDLTTRTIIVKEELINIIAESGSADKLTRYFAKNDIPYVNVDIIVDSLIANFLKSVDMGPAGLDDLDDFLIQTKEVLREASKKYKATLARLAEDIPQVNPLNVPLQAGLKGYYLDESLIEAVESAYKPTSDPLKIKAFNSIYRAVKTTWDFSAVGIQGLKLMYNNPRIFAEVAGKSILAAGSPRMLQNFIKSYDHSVVRGMKTFRNKNGKVYQRNMDGLTAEEWVNKGQVHIGGAQTEFSFPRWADKKLTIPVVKQVASTYVEFLEMWNRSFGFFGDMARLRWADDLLVKELAKGRTLEEIEKSGDLIRIGKNVNRLTGYSPTRFGGDIGEYAMFASRYFQSRIESAGKGLQGLGGDVLGLDTTLEKTLAKKAMLRTIGEASTLTVLINESQGHGFLGDKSFNYWDYKLDSGHDNPNFMKVRVPRIGDLSLLGKDLTFFKLFASVGSGEFSKVFGLSSGAVQKTWLLLMGESPSGMERSGLPWGLKNLGDFENPYTWDWEKFASFTLGTLEPFSLDELGERVEEVAPDFPGPDMVRSAIEQGTGAVTEFLGFDISMISPSEKLDMIRREVMITEYPEKYNQATRWDEIDRDDRDAIDEHPLVKEAIIYKEGKSRGLNSRYQNYKDEKDKVINDSNNKLKAAWDSAVKLGDEGKNIGFKKYREVDLPNILSDKRQKLDDLRERADKAFDFLNEEDGDIKEEISEFNTYLDKYYDIFNDPNLEKDGEFNFRLLNTNIVKLHEKMREDLGVVVADSLRKRVEKYLDRHDTAGERALSKAREIIRPYWLISDAMILKYDQEKAQSGSADIEDVTRVHTSGIFWLKSEDYRGIPPAGRPGSGGKQLIEVGDRINDLDEKYPILLKPNLWDRYIQYQDMEGEPDKTAYLLQAGNRDLYWLINKRIPYWKSLFLQGNPDVNKELLKWGYKTPKQKEALREVAGRPSSDISIDHFDQLPSGKEMWEIRPYR